MHDDSIDASAAWEPARIATKVPKKAYSTSKVRATFPVETRHMEHLFPFVSIRKVVNGWIVTTSSHEEGGEGNTLVFNTIEGLCKGIEILYEEEKDED